MKRVILALCVGLGCLLQPVKATAQEHEIQQLLLNVEKLAQFKKILQNMYDGYKILHKGYTAVKDISEGNFSLHKTFLDNLLEVNPAVKKYKRVADIVSYQLRIVKESRQAINRFKSEGQFTAQELAYLTGVYEKLLKQSLQNLDDLVMVVTAGTLRMSDDERLQAIDRIYKSVEDQFSFLKDFTGSTTMLSFQRKAAAADVELSRRISGVK